LPWRSDKRSYDLILSRPRLSEQTPGPPERVSFRPYLKKN
jgi:hypothetical protein